MSHLNAAHRARCPLPPSRGRQRLPPSRAPFTLARPRRTALHVMAGHPVATQWIREHLGGGQVARETFLGGSGWSSADVVQLQGGQRYFVKTALGRDESMFRGEALGLQAMYDTHTLTVPKVFHVGSLSAAAGSSSSGGSGAAAVSGGTGGGWGGGGGGSFIVMEHLDLRGGDVDMAALGRGLAAMHLATPKDPRAASGQFGFPVDNTLGATPQRNGWCGDWVDFLRERRLAPQLRMTGDARLMRLGEQLCAKLHTFFEGIEVRPSVLHGDLWSGNIGAVGGQPAVFDPATYYGHHEAEFGMSWCAGFTPDFYRAYHELIPRAPGFEQRAEIYRLYHYLNHLNLFGDSYYSQCASILQRLA